MNKLWTPLKAREKKMELPPALVFPLAIAEVGLYLIVSRLWMAGEASQVGAGIALDALTGRVTQTARTTYATLATAAATDTSTVGAHSEIATAGYARQSVAWTAPTGDPQSTNNSGAITFGPFTADPPNVTDCALVSSASGTGGDFLHRWTLDVAKDAAINESIQFAAAALVTTQD